MSGTFQDIDVPPTTCIICSGCGRAERHHYTGIEKAGNKLVWLRVEKDQYDLPVYAQVMDQYGKFREDIQNGNIVSAYVLDRHGIAAAVSKMAFGNRMGCNIRCERRGKRLRSHLTFGDLIAEVPG